MKKAWVYAALALAALLALPGTSARAQAKNGFGLFGGVASHNDNGSFNSTSPFVGQDISYTSSGLSVGIDYQFAVSESFSINPFLMSSAESASGDVGSGTTAGHGILGLEFRYWPSDIFVGAHIGNYSEVLSASAGSSISASGGGFGASLGWERADGLMVFGQLDHFKVSYSDADLDVNAIRVQVGYRWK
jgi:hypothetical protein